MMARFRILVACERSGNVRRAFRDLGYDAWSNDLVPADDGSPYHIQGDALTILDDGWDALIAHPPCTYLSNSGAKHLYIDMRKENGIYVPRWHEMEKGAAFFNALVGCRIPIKAVENPVMHCHAAARCGRATQFVQPWWFGNPFFKATGFKLIGLPKLVPTNKLTPPRPGTPEHKAWSMIFRMPPGPDRARKRSEFFPGMCAAMASQWGAYLESLQSRRAA